jgi:type IV secretory pathway VirB4 component
MLLEDGRCNDQKVQFLTGLIELMITEKGRGDTGILSIERAILDRLIRDVYATQRTRPILGDVQQRLLGYEKYDKDPEAGALARSMGKRLGIWCEGSYARLLNQKESIEPTASLVAFDLKGLEGQLQAVVLAILAGITWNRIQKNDRKKLIVFDEVWTLLGDRSTARFIEELYRTARKYHCGILSISQSLQDFVSSPAAAAILANSIVRYVLRITDGLELIQEKFGLNDREMFLIRRLRREKGRFSELFLCFGDKRAVIRVEPSPEEYWVCTTHGEDRKMERKVEEEHPDWSALERLKLLAKEHPCGA